MLFRSIFLLALVQAAFSAAITTDAAAKQPQCHDDKGNSICLTPGCIRAASDVLNNIDYTVNPCDDIYNFACGNYIRKTTIPGDESFQMSFTKINDKVTERIQQALEAPESDSDGRAINLAKGYYKMCTDVHTIDATSLPAAKALLSELGGWPLLEGSQWKEADFDWKTLMYKTLSKGMPPFSLLAVGVGTNNKNSSRRMFSISQAGLSMERSFLLEGFDNEIVKAAYEMMVDVAVIFGADRATALNEVKETFEFQIELAKITLPAEQQRDFNALTNHMTISELQTKYPEISWLEFINSILAVADVTVTEDEVVNVSMPKYITDLIQLLSHTPKRTQANYMMGRIVSDLIPYLNKVLSKKLIRFQQVSLGTTSADPRWKQCVNDVKSSFSIAVSALYARTYVRPDVKRNAAELVTNLREAFRDLLNNIDWMDAATKVKAQEKADAIAPHIAYPDQLLDNDLLNNYYKKLSPGSTYLESALNGGKFVISRQFGNLHNPIDKTDWTEFADATSVNAYYMVEQNGIILPAGILQGAFFDEERPHYMNYGAMGFVIGHEITHGFDDVGRQFNKDGAIEEWWGEETKQKYLERAQCIIDQYSNYTSEEVHLKLNGINTQGENIADNGGVKEAYFAYNKWVERNGEEPRLPGLDFTPNQMFWISSANLWCTKVRNEYLVQQITGDAHSPSYFRVLGAFSNSEQFAHDFNCPSGSRMNPVHKCSVW